MRIEHNIDGANPSPNVYISSGRQCFRYEAVHVLRDLFWSHGSAKLPKFEHLASALAYWRLTLLLTISPLRFTVILKIVACTKCYQLNVSNEEPEAIDFCLSFIVGVLVSFERSRQLVLN